MARTREQLQADIHTLTEQNTSFAREATSAAAPRRKALEGLIEVNDQLIGQYTRALQDAE
jgi:hypothetical protein